jgi:hypothetical protein
MFPSAKNTTPFGCSPNPNFEEKSSHPFGSFPKPQISDLAVLAAYPFGSILSSVSKGDIGMVSLFSDFVKLNSKLIYSEKMTPKMEQNSKLASSIWGFVLSKAGIKVTGSGN